VLGRLVSLLLIVLLAACVGCGSRLLEPPSPIQAGYNPIELIDPVGEADAEHGLDMKELYTIAERLRQERRPAVLPPQRNVLVLSGGGAYGSFSAGVLVGWTRNGTRPPFDVVTGISTGSLIAPFAFLGSEYDSQLKEVYTTLRNNDVFRIRKTVRTLLLITDSLADNSPLGRKIDEIITPDLLRKIACEHRNGRRLYIGTTELESKRPVIWDMGEIACRGTMDDLHLFRKVLLASTAIPGFFPPVKIPVTVEGKALSENHVDGGVTNALFFRPPYISPEMRDDPSTSLYGSNVYTLVAGKLYADPNPVRSRALTIAADSVSTLIYAQTRGDLLKLYTACLLTGMNYFTASIPSDYPAPSSSTDFDPKVMSKMFDEGFRQSVGGMQWRTTPPGLEPGEGAFLRTGTDLQVVPLNVPKAPIPTRRVLPGRRVTK
jgi:predicted acylesterase/phospholipase RssA